MSGESCRFRKIFQFPEKDQFIWKFQPPLFNQIYTAHLFRGQSRLEYVSFETRGPDSSVIDSCFKIYFQSFIEDKIDTMRVVPHESKRRRLPPGLNQLRIVSVKADVVYSGDTSRNAVVEFWEHIQKLSCHSEDCFVQWITGFWNAEFPDIAGLTEIVFTISVDGDDVIPNKELMNLDPKPDVREKRPSRFQKFFLSEKLSDIEIHADDRIFPCHKVILAATCEVFNQMFEYGTKESSEGRIQVEGVTGKTVTAFLQYLYTGDCDFFKNKEVDGLIELYIVADRYLMEDLKSTSLQLLISAITEDNGLEIGGLILEFGKSHGFSEVTNALDAFCWKNRKLVDVDGHYMQQLVKRCFPQSLCPTAENCSFCHGVEM